MLVDLVATPSCDISPAQPAVGNQASFNVTGSSYYLSVEAGPGSQCGAAGQAWANYNTPHLYAPDPTPTKILARCKSFISVMFITLKSAN